MCVCVCEVYIVVVIQERCKSQKLSVYHPRQRPSQHHKMLKGQGEYLKCMAAEEDRSPLCPADTSGFSLHTISVQQKAEP